MTKPKGKKFVFEVSIKLPTLKEDRGGWRIQISRKPLILWCFFMESKLFESNWVKYQFLSGKFSTVYLF